MKNHIAEDLPARKFAPAAAGSAPAPVGKDNKKDNSGKTPEERATQAVYDIRYKARKDEISLLNAYTEYMKSSSMSGEERNMVKAKLFRKVSGGMRAEDFNPIFKNAASDNVAKALFKVFVEKKEINIEDLKEFYTRRNSRGEVVFHVRITDKKTKNSYTRDVTRKKLNKLRANPNIDIEMSEYRKDSEIERTRGALTARVTAGKGLDPVGQEDGDVDNDGDRDKSDKYLMKRRGAIGNAIATRKEEFIHEAGAKKNSTKKRSDKLDVMPPGQRNTVNMSPTQGGNERVEIVAHNELEGELIAETGYSKFLKKVKEEMDCGSDDKKKKNGVDNRSRPTEINIAKNIVRASTGIKNPMVMVSNDEDVKEGLGLSVGASQLAGRLLANPRTSAEQGAKNFQKNVADPVGRAVKGAVRAVFQPANMSPEAQKARRDKYRPEEVEFEGEVIDEAEQRIRQPRKSANPRGTYDPTGIGQYPRTGKERKKMRKGEPVVKYPSLERKSKPMNDDENPPRRRYGGDDHPSLTAAERNPGLK
jgi:hypothetical protein